MPIGFDALVALSKLTQFIQSHMDKVDRSWKESTKSDVYPQGMPSPIDMMPPAGVIFKGAFRPHLPKHTVDPEWFPPFKWFYGDTMDIPKFNATPRAYSALVNPQRGLMGVAIPQKADDFILHQTLLEEARAAQEAAIRRGATPKPYELGYNPYPLDEYGHVRVHPDRPGFGGSARVTIGAPWDENIQQSKNMAQASRVEDRLLEQITEILGRRNMLPPDVPIQYNRIYPPSGKGGIMPGALADPTLIEYIRSMQHP